MGIIRVCDLRWKLALHFCGEVEWCCGSEWVNISLHRWFDGSVVDSAQECPGDKDSYQRRLPFIMDLLHWGTSLPRRLSSPVHHQSGHFQWNVINWSRENGRFVIAWDSVHFGEGDCVPSLGVRALGGRPLRLHDISINAGALVIGRGLLKVNR